MIIVGVRRTRCCSRTAVICAHFLELKGVSLATANDIVPWLVVEHEQNSLEEGFGVEIEQKGQCLLIGHEIHYVKDVSPELRLHEVSLWKLLSLEEQTEDPEKLVANVE